MKGRHRICLTNRNCFSIAGSGRYPFVMGAGSISMDMLNARFGVGTCPGVSGMIAALRRKSVHVSLGHFSSSCLLRPSSRVICVPSAKRVREGHIGTSSCSS